MADEAGRYLAAVHVAAKDAAVASFAADDGSAAVRAAVAVGSLDHSSPVHLCLRNHVRIKTFVLLRWHYLKNDCSKSSLQGEKIEQKC
jgi:hypothetical protein